MFRNIAFLAALAALASAKIASSLQRELAIQDKVDVILEFGGNSQPLNAATESIQAFTERSERIGHIFSTLQTHAINAQKEVLSHLATNAPELTFQSNQVGNVLFVNKVTQAQVDELAAFPQVTRVRLPYVAHLPVLKVESVEAAANSSSIAATNEWGVTKIGAPSVWANGNRGEGIVVSNIDTGVLYTHEALKGNWRSDYGWYDPSAKKATPYDGNGHGSHTMGQVDCLPWMHDEQLSRSHIDGLCSMDLVPNRHPGKNANCAKAPNVVSNSWGGSTGGDSWYQSYVDAWRKAGIIPVFANGNAGPTCGSVASPGDYKNVIGVGATDSSDKLASFSSKGATKDKRVKPDVSAPGQSVRSAWYTGNTAYNTISGTSMATPHVAGAVALILAAKPGATYDTVYSLLTKTVDTSTLVVSTANCGGVSNKAYPNNDYGYGRINVLKATSSTTKSSAVDVIDVNEVN
ncbi:Suppressor of the cold-sensitive snRNP biogenesis mutant brr1-1 [Aphanomyces cochlioides]|nr:Suppressor of the cold-sensitive snRNP biogenesis mutant brr1-1 [Aphanomyces cochlioides]